MRYASPLRRNGRNGRVVENVRENKLHVVLALNKRFRNRVPDDVVYDATHAPIIHVYTLDV